MKKLLVCLGTLLLLSSCVGLSNEKTVSKSEYSDRYDADGVVCRLEAVVGSNRKRKVCTTASEREEMREAAREGWLRTQKSSETGGGDL